MLLTGGSRQAPKLDIIKLGAQYPSDLLPHVIETYNPPFSRQPLRISRSRLVGQLGEREANAVIKTYKYRPLPRPPRPRRNPVEHCIQVLGPLGYTIVGPAGLPPIGPGPGPGPGPAPPPPRARSRSRSRSRPRSPPRAPLPEPEDPFQVDDDYYDNDNAADDLADLLDQPAPVPAGPDVDDAADARQFNEALLEQRRQDAAEAERQREADQLARVLEPGDLEPRAPRGPRRHVVDRRVRAEAKAEQKRQLDEDEALARAFDIQERGNVYEAKEEKRRRDRRKRYSEGELGLAPPGPRRGRGFKRKRGNFFFHKSKQEKKMRVYVGGMNWPPKPVLLPGYGLPGYTWGGYRRSNQKKRRQRGGYVNFLGPALAAYNALPSLGTVAAAVAPYAVEYARPVIEHVASALDIKTPLSKHEAREQRDFEEKKATRLHAEKREDQRFEREEKAAERADKRAERAAERADQLHQARLSNTINRSSYGAPRASSYRRRPAEYIPAERYLAPSARNLLDPPYGHAPRYAQHKKIQRKKRAAPYGKQPRRPAKKRKRQLYYDY